jgi:hypothetical protein
LMLFNHHTQGDTLGLRPDVLPWAIESQPFRLNRQVKTPFSGLNFDQ